MWLMPVGPLAPKSLHLGRWVAAAALCTNSAYSGSLFLPSLPYLLHLLAPPLSCLANGYSYHNVCTLSTRSRPTAFRHDSVEEEEEGFG